MTTVKGAALAAPEAQCARTNSMSYPSVNARHASAIWYTVARARLTGTRRELDATIVELARRIERLGAEARGYRPCAALWRATTRASEAHDQTKGRR